jgi:hypothetical protein
MRIMMNIFGYLLGAIVIAAGIGALIVGGMRDRDPKALAAAGRLCPPLASLPARVPGAPVDDIAGVRIGHNAADMESILRCIDENYVFRTEPVWHTLSPSGAQSEKQIVYAELGQDRLAAGFAGPARSEVIVALWREVVFAGETAPLKSTTEATLIQYYGAPHVVEETALRRILNWAYDPQGVALKTDAKNADLVKQLSNWVSGSLVAPTCIRQVRMSPLDKPAFNQMCGLTIRIEIEGRLEAPEKVSTVKTAVIDQARAADAVAEYRASRP